MPQSRYNELALTFRLWVYLRHIRRGGGAHIAGRVNGLVPGSLTIDCPACPQPGKNLVTECTKKLLSLLYPTYTTYLTNHPPQLDQYSISFTRRKLQAETEVSWVQ